MRSISPSNYAQALVKVLSAKESESAAHTHIENFLEVLRKNGDWAKRHQIMKEFQKLWRVHHKRDSLLVESARPLQPQQREALKKQLGTHTHLDLEEALNPELIAGVRLTLNGELQMDTSLAHILKRVFPRK